MKQTLLLTIILFWGLLANCQDIIVKRNSEEIKAKILEINLLEIKYRRFESTDGPIYVISKSEVFFIKYQNGTKEVITPIDQPYQYAQAKVTGPTVKDGFYLNFAPGIPFALGAYGKSLDNLADRVAFDFNIQFGARLINFLGLRVQSGSSAQGGKAKSLTSASGLILSSTTDLIIGHSYVTAGPEFLVDLGNEGVFSLHAGYGSSRTYAEVGGSRSNEVMGNVWCLATSVRFYLHNRVAFMPSIQYLKITNSGIGSVEMINLNAGIAINFERFK